MTLIDSGLLRLSIQISSCDLCQNHKLRKTAATLHPIPVKDEVWHQLDMDLAGPLPETAAGYKYIMTVTDYYTKWAEAAPMKDKTASSVADVSYSLS